MLLSDGTVNLTATTQKILREKVFHDLVSRCMHSKGKFIIIMTLASKQ